MNSLNRKLAIGGIVFGLLIGSAFGASETRITSGYNTDDSVMGHYTIVTNNTTTIEWYGYLTGPSGGGGIHIDRNGSTVLDDWLTVNAPTKGATLSGLGSGTYDITHGFGGIPYQIYGYIYTKLTW